ncbi:S9 family peptidase [Mesoterricola silvestris]|uniref:Oligopeptidase B n=1 Tax=Mesoterricola silvestris TaxID=2927979 RepID=A0AA48KAV5_9BACT|nr:S9 family peptidase [Mesoterricola silvestris]BDU74465.1 oligopeptidase B [Mesoterricola silvestris]
MRSFRFPLLALVLAAAQAHGAAPAAPTVAHVDLRFGESIADPYAWLRNRTDPEVLKYLEAENAHTEAATAGLKPLREALYKEMLGRIKQTDLSVPVRKGRFYYYTRTEEGKQYPIRCRKAAGPSLAFDAAAPEEVLLDLNEMAKGLTFLGVEDVSVSDDGNLLLYCTDTTGYRQYDLHLKDLRTGKVLGPTAQRVTSVEWAADNRTFFFTTEDAVTKRSDTAWRMGLDGKAVKLVEEKDELFRLGLNRTKDGKFVILEAESTDTWENSYLDAARPEGAFRVLLPREKGHKYKVDHREGLFYLRTNKGALDFRIVTVPAGDPGTAAWKTFVAPRDGVHVEGLELFKGFAVVREKREGLATFRVLDFATGKWHEIRQPEAVYFASGGSTPEYDSVQFRYHYQSQVTPPTTFDYHMGRRETTLLKRQEVLGYDPALYATERAWATARDGVRVPLSLVYRKGLRRDGKAPLFLYAYGSYGYGTPAAFDSNRISLLDRGVVFAVAHIRGGDELGEGWHRDGMLMKKMNTFTDFIDCAESLVAGKWTSSDRLVIEGGSAGGLLMGAVTNLRPDLFKAVHAAVPFVDVMNTMLDPTLPLTVGEYLEWGNPNEKAAYDYMRSYSPYDNLARKAYPAMLVTSSLNDSQVGYWEPAKYVARLRTLKTDSNELLLRMKLEPGGHGGASGRYDRLRDKAFEYAWMLRQMGITK